MVPVISVVGKSNSGKTTLIEKLVAELKRRGYRVGTLKHDVHGFEIDREGKDTWRHAQAGAETVGIVSPTKMAVIRNTDEEPSLEEVISDFYQGMDLVITEGFKRGNQPKIEVCRSDVSSNLLCMPHELLALVSDRKHDLGLQVFPLDDVRVLTDFIVDTFLVTSRGIPSSPETTELKTTLWVDDQEVRLKGFVQDFVGRTVLGMISALRGVRVPQSVRVEVKVKAGHGEKPTTQYVGK